MPAGIFVSAVSWLRHGPVVTVAAVAAGLAFGLWLEWRAQRRRAVDDRRVRVVNPPANTELEAARRELQERYRRLAATRPFSWSRMGDQMRIARLKRRIAKLEGAEKTNPL